MKKILSVALALLMILSCVTVMASALQSRAVCEISVTPTQDSYNKGDVVTFEVSYEGSEEDYNLGGPVVIGFGFDSSVYETIEDLTSNKNGNEQNTYIVEGYPIGTDYTPAMSAVRVINADGTSASDNAKGWDKILHIAIPSFKYWDYSEKKGAFAFKLRIKEDADPNGGYSVGVSDEYHQKENVNIYDELGGIWGSDTESFEFQNSTMFSFVDGTPNIAGVATSSPVQYSKAQIRFHGVKADGDFANYQKQFDVRTVAKISEADFNATFTDEATAKEKISDIGFVYVRTKNVSSFDVDTAKQVAEGGSAGNYVKKSVSYIQHANSGADYIFTCLISDIDDADKTDVVSCLGYVCFDGTYYYFDAAATVNFNDLYTTYYKGA